MSRSIADRPTIHLIDTEQTRLLDLAHAIRSRQPELSELLQAELDRAEVHDAASLPPGVVCMHSTVEFLDEGSGTRRTVQLVYPHEADIAAGRISVLTPVGAGLIGLSEGQSILWPNRVGQERPLRIIQVTRETGGA
jgi:regulator of nucleoside diphosphate kinase